MGMKGTRSRIFWLLLAVALAGMYLTACSGGGAGMDTDAAPEIELSQLKYVQVWLRADEALGLELSFLDMEGEVVGNTFTARREHLTGYESITVALDPTLSRVISFEIAATYQDESPWPDAEVYLSFSGGDIPRVEGEPAGGVRFGLYGEEARNHFDSVYAEIRYADGSSKIFTEEDCQGRWAVDIALAPTHFRAPD